MKRAALLLLSVVIAYTLSAYVVLPAFWTHYEHQKGLAELPMVTRTAQGIPGDPINVGLVGEVWILRLVEACRKQAGPAAVIASPAATEIKDQIWQAVAGATRK